MLLLSGLIWSEDGNRRGACLPGSCLRTSACLRSSARVPANAVRDALHGAASDERLRAELLVSTALVVSVRRSTHLGR
jgi:hypothetical protein